jgi:uncharacterized OsmC-like protein
LFHSTKNNDMKKQSEVKQRQNALTDVYLSNPSLALITHSSEVLGANLHDPFRTSVTVSDDLQVPFKVGIHRAVGGDHDLPNPSDMLCAALASCFESTIRLISNRLDIKLSETRVTASAQVDVRGTLMIDKSVSVGYQSMHLDVVLVSHAPNQKIMNILLRAAEQSCIVYQTMKRGVPITLTSRLEALSPAMNSSSLN